MRILGRWPAFFICIALPFSSPAISVEMGKEMMVRDLETIRSVFHTKYAPADWKKEYTNWELDEQIEIAKQKVLETPNITVKDFQRILLAFFNSTKDYHATIQFFSTEFSLLPFRIQSAEGRYFITWLDNAIPPDQENLHGVSIGDEVISFDGLPIGDAVQEFKEANFGDLDSATDQALAEIYLTLRVGVLGHYVPSGPVDITVRSADGDRNYTLSWIHSPEKIHSPFIDGTRKSYFPELPENLSPSVPLIDINMITPHYFNSIKINEMIHRELQRMGNGRDNGGYGLHLGRRKSFVPPLGPILWEAPSYIPYHAYLFEGPNRSRIGYLRIPTYTGNYFDVVRFSEVINYFEVNSDALVIDQVDNPGGNLFYMYALTSMFANRPLKTPKDRLRITQQEVYFAIQSIGDLERVRTDADAVNVFGPTLWGFPVNYHFAKEALSYFRFILEEWNAGRTFTDLVHPYGVEYLRPHSRSCYTKPVCVLVNKLDFSCADYFPAILQDNERALIVGEPTAGAGGSVLDHIYPNLFGITGFSFTASISERTNKQPIENLGITPDVPLELTARDLQEGYVDYAEKIVSSLKNLKGVN